MRRAVYPGSFDPVTFGHLDIIRRSAVLVDELIVGVLTNSAKTPLFSAEERVNILADVTKDIGNVTIKAFDGRRFCKELRSTVYGEGSAGDHRF